MNKSSNTIAVIDVGSHSILLLLGRRNFNGEIKVLDQQFATAKLGQDLQKSLRLSDQAIERALQILEKMYKSIKRYSPDRVHIIGTAALRKAQNANDFIVQVFEKFDWKIKVLDAEEEAHYSYLGSVEANPDEQEKYLVMDVGGGSTEFITGMHQRIEYKQSLELGAVNLAEQINKKESLCSSDRLGTMAFIKLKLGELRFLEHLNPQHVFIGTGGTISTLAAIKLKMAKYNSDKINAVSLSREDLWQIYFMLSDKSIAERSRVIGMDLGREDVIIYGALIFLTFMELQKIDLIKVSDRGLRFGYMKSLFKEMDN